MDTPTLAVIAASVIWLPVVGLVGIALVFKASTMLLRFIFCARCEGCGRPLMNGSKVVVRRTALNEMWFHPACDFYPNADHYKTGEV